MDTLARKLRAKDIPVRVTNFSNWRGFAAVLVDLYPSDKSIAPVVIIGHSLGADSAIDMANYLAENGVPVRLVVAFDGVHGGHKVVARRRRGHQLLQGRRRRKARRGGARIQGQAHQCRPQRPQGNRSPQYREVTGAPGRGRGEDGRGVRVGGLRWSGPDTPTPNLPLEWEVGVACFIRPATDDHRRPWREPS